ncbi:MAG: outer membrane protein transport protein [candidate division Zixibacteria bacterium]|nr:outer membrane protein transport protein [candidate division Zixibacteria bacterium]
MRRKLSFSAGSRFAGLVLFVVIFSAGSVFGFGLEAETDTITFATIQNFFFSPIQISDYNFLGGGARARAMGGAFFAVSNDPTAASWNPAGLSLLNKAQMDLSFSSFMSRPEHTATLKSSILDFGFSNKPKYDKNQISSIGIVIPFKKWNKEMAVSALYQVLSDIYQENEYALINDTLQTNQEIPITNWKSMLTEKITGRLSAITLALGAKTFGSLSLGLGVNIYAGGFNSDVNLFYPKGYYQDITIDTLTGDTTVNLYEKFHPSIKTDYSGFNFTFGGMYQIDKLKLAAVVKTPFTLKEDNDVKLLVDYVEGGVLVNTKTIALSPMFKTDRKWKMPVMIGFGSSYQLKDLTLAGDVEFRNYSKSKLTYRDNLANPTGAEITTSLDWRNLTQFRIGGEYWVHTKYGNIPIRAGFRNDPKLFTNSYDSMTVYMEEHIHQIGEETFLWPTYLKSKPGTETGSWVNGNVFSFGTGIAWSQIKFDITFEFAKYDEVQQQVFTEIVAFNRGFKKIDYEVIRPNLKEFSQKTSNKYNRIMVSFTGFF